MSLVQIACLHSDVGQAEYMCRIFAANGIDAVVSEHTMDFPEPLSASAIYILLFRRACSYALWPVTEAQNAFAAGVQVLPLCMDDTLPTAEISLFAGDLSPVFMQQYPFFIVMAEIVRRIQTMLSMNTTLPLVLDPEAEVVQEDIQTREPPLEIADERLLMALQTQLQTKEPITRSKAKSIRFLDLRGYDIEDISPLAAFSSLEVLLLCSNKIRDLSPLENLMGLSILDAEDNQIENIDALTRLARLETLSLSDNVITDLSPLSYHANLRRVYLSNNRIFDIAPLATITNLTHLHLAGNRIYSVSAVSRLQQLVSLDLSKNNLQNADALGTLNALQVLRLSDNAVESCEFVQQLANLRVLLADNTKFSVLKPLQNLTSLRILHLSNCRISDLSPLCECTQLCDLVLSGNAIEDLSGLEDCTALRCVHVEDNLIQNADVLCRLPVLERNGTSRQRPLKPTQLEKRCRTSMESKPITMVIFRMIP
ncbi:MAG: leucine-rich repeat domain-containing protein [Clostridia bacterium]|nr:leucine-rich repeat domain-containing protein [Clostridia bacterium]